MKLTLLTTIWFLAYSATAVFASHVPSVHDIASVADPLLNSGSLVIASLLMLVGILLIAVVTLYKDNKADSKERQKLSLQTLQVLSDLDKTIEANTDARVRVGG